jgi:DNA-binding SARP family transcriptional activator
LRTHWWRAIFCIPPVQKLRAMRYTLRTLTLKPGLVTGQDEPECIRFSKQLTLIIYLALRPRARATREELLGLLWAGATEHDARSSLRQVLYQIRQATDADLVVGDEVLRLRREDVDFDVDLFRLHHAQGRLEEALQLYEADFLSNVAQAGAGEFEEWAEGLRQQLAAERRQVLRTLISRMADQGRWSQGAQYAQLLIEADPGVLEPRVKLVELLALSGDAIRAAGAAAEARAFVESIEGSRLSPEVERAIGQALAPVVPGTRDATEPLVRLPEMVGRAAEFRVLVDKWRSALEGRGKAALLTGEAGIGKTRLTHELVGRLRRDRGLILRSACYAVEQSDPMAPFLDLLRSAPRAPGLAGTSPGSLGVLGAFVPEIADRFRSAVAPSTLPVAPQALGTALLDAFAAIADEVPLLLVVEDLHWASPEAIEFAHRLARRAQSHHILLLLTARDYGDVPGTTESLRALTATGAVKEIPLGPLDLPEVEQLLGSIAEPPDSASGRWLAQELVQRTQGIPLYILEVLKSLHDSGLLSDLGGRWVFAAGLGPGHGDLPIPESAAEILEYRLHTVGERPAAVLAAMAVWGRGCRADVLARLTGLDAHEVDRAVAALERRRLVNREDGLPVVAHEALSAAALRAAPGALLEHLHERAARLARDAARGGRAGDWMAAARYAALAGRPERAAVDLAHAAAAVERSSGRAAGQDTLTRALGTMPQDVRAHLEIAFQRVLEGRWSARRWLAERTSWPRRLRFGATVAGTVLVGAAAILAPRLLHSRPHPGPLGGGYLAVTWGDPYSRPAGVLALRLDAQLAAESLPPRVLPAGIASGYAERDVQPGGGVALTVCALPNVDPTAVCAVDLATGARRPLFRYDGDADPVGWLPDGVHFVATGGYLTARSGYAYAILLVDSAGHLARTIARDSFSYAVAAVAPAGDQVLATRTLGRRRDNVMIDLAGRVRPLTSCQGATVQAWSRDGATIACTRESDHTLVLMRAANPDDYVTVPLNYAEASSPVWSPDSRHLAVALRGPRPGIYVVDAVALRAPVFVWPLGRNGAEISWVPPVSPPRIVSLHIAPKAVTLHVGQSLGLTVYGFDGAGRRVDEPPGVRWLSLDSGLVRLGASGAVIADRPGAARIVAALGLTEADTVTITVASAPPRRLLYESFDKGLNPAVWKPFGNPAPRVLAGAGRLGTLGFNNNGDYSRSSGIALRRRLSLVKGLTIEYWAKIPIRYRLWESIGVGLASGAADSFALRQGDPRPPGSFETLHAEAPNPNSARVQMTASLYTDLGSSVGELPLALRDGRWHRYRLVIYPSGEVRWFADGRELVPPARADIGSRPAWTLTLDGQSYRTLAVMDDVTVWEGVVLDPVEPATPAARRMSGGRVSK